MKTLRRLCAAFVLTLMLALSAFAGEIQTTIVSQPPPDPATAQGQMDTTIAGQMGNPLIVTDSVTQAALNLLESALSLF